MGAGLGDLEMDLRSGPRDPELRLCFVGIPKLAWLQDEHVIIYAIVLVSVWKMLGYFVVVYGVGLRNIPDELLEASELDGATPWQRLIYVVIPMMKPIILFTVIIATIIFFNVFAPVYVLPPRRRARRPTTSRW